MQQVGDIQSDCVFVRGRVAAQKINLIWRLSSKELMHIQTQTFPTIWVELAWRGFRKSYRRQTGVKT